MVLYHYSTDFDNVVYGEIKANPAYSDPDLKPAYLWLEKEVGFYPLFLAVGSTEEDVRMTGYQTQWDKIVGSEIIGRRNDGTYIQRNILRKAGEFPDYVLFSFESVDGVFMDFMDWHIPMNQDINGREVTGYEKRKVFKPSWPKSRWLRKAREDPHSVQLVTPWLYLPDAKRVWVRNQYTKAALESMGFENVEVQRLSAH